MEKLKCSSCKSIITNLEGSTRFACPSCGKTTIIRCNHCRDVGTKYTCAECNFEGPN
ncbi:MAG TPA: zinc finger domain-containing protein [Candidatus Nanoarchaeia archaeon]|nr:zinc finger domain-containing protein [Candidatus Nanoarchaeia archaeon]